MIFTGGFSNVLCALISATPASGREAHTDALADGELTPIS